MGYIPIKPMRPPPPPPMVRPPPTIAEAEANFNRLLHSYNRKNFTKPTRNPELTQAKDIYTGESIMGQTIPPCPKRKDHQKILLESALTSVSWSINHNIIEGKKDRCIKYFERGEITLDFVPVITQAITDQGYECKYERCNSSSIAHQFHIAIPEKDEVKKEVSNYQFQYTAMNGSGKEKKGVIRADNESDAQQQLKDQGLFPMSINALRTTIVEAKKNTRGLRNYYYEAMNGRHIHEVGHLSVKNVEDAQRELKTRGLFALKIEQVGEGKKESKAKEDAKKLVECTKTKLSESAKATTTSLLKLLSTALTKLTNFLKEVKKDW